MRNCRLVRRILCCGLVVLAAGCSQDKPKAQCSAFDPCGGNVQGTWSISSSCVEGNLTALANLSPQLPVECQGMYRVVTGDMQGMVAFNGDASADIDTTLTVSYQIIANAECAASQGLTNLDASNCMSLGPDFVLAGLHEEVTCAWDDQACRCAGKDVFTTKERRTYAISGAKITYSGSTDYLEFCVDGSVMHGRQFDGAMLTTFFIDAQHQS